MISGSANTLGSLYLSKRRLLTDPVALDLFHPTASGSGHSRGKTGL